MNADQNFVLFRNRDVDVSHIEHIGRTVSIADEGLHFLLTSRRPIIGRWQGDRRHSQLCDLRRSYPLIAMLVQGLGIELPTSRKSSIFLRRNAFGDAAVPLPARLRALFRMAASADPRGSQAILLNVMIRLIGPGGAGKSTIGALLAQRLDVRFLDLDRHFAARVGDISEYISRHGYDAYARENIEAYCSLFDVDIRPDVVALSSGFMTHASDAHLEDGRDSRRNVYAGEREVRLFVLLGKQMPRAELKTLRVRSRPQWRAWLEKHHTSSPGVWLVRYKAHTGVKSIPYEDMVRQALCFGWIDSLVKRLDDDRYAIKVTPRQPTSKWSDVNRKRWAELKAAGLLTSAGLAAAPTDNSYAPRPVIPDLPVYIAKALKTNVKAWEFFRELAPTYRRDFVVWIHTAKRPETRERRIRESIRLLAAGKKLGLK